MVGTRKRKHASTNDATASKMQNSIKTFGSIGKPHNADNSVKKRKTAHQITMTPLATTKSEEQHIGRDGKRKRSRDAYTDDVQGRYEETQGLLDSFLVKTNTSIPHSKRLKTSKAPLPTETPSKSTAALLSKLKLDTGSASIPFALANARRSYKTPPETSPGEGPVLAQTESRKLQDLSQLHTALLRAMSLHYAQNGSSSPVNVDELLPIITNVYRKRTVGLHDLRQILAVEEGDQAAFRLQDFGRGGVYLAKAQQQGQTRKSAATFIDETNLGFRFEDALQSRWMRWRTTAVEDSDDETTFINQLQLAEIAKSNTVEKAAPIFACGQQRLASLKASRAAEKPESSTSPNDYAEQTTTLAVENRSTSLLSRVLSKQAHTALLPRGPTRDQLERHAALQRIEEIARVLELLAAGRTRCSFGMQAMVQRLQQSLRNPISRVEALRCLELMSSEITPGFVAVVNSGRVSGVVVTRVGKTSLEELRCRIREATSRAAV